jgi:hypothetical protein
VQCAFQAAGPSFGGLVPFYLSPNGTCELCDPDALLGCDFAKGCNPDGSCIACDPYTRLVDGKCVPCPDGCSSGFTNSTALCNDQAKCTACIEGYVLTDAGECAACPLDCTKCDAKDPATCLACFAGYGFNGTTAGGCVACADELCEDCSKDYAECKRCADGHWLSPDGACQPLEDNCVAANAQGNCTECFFGYVPVDGACQACDPSTGADCATCDPANLSVCLECDNPNNTTMLRDGKCVPPCKDSNCQTCPSPDAGTCDKCFSGYGLVNGTCKACIGTDYSFACDECNGDIEVCTRCAAAPTGLYSLVGGQCIFVDVSPPSDGLTGSGNDEQPLEALPPAGPV